MEAQPDVGGISLLLVEDDEKLARITAQYLESHGIHVELAFDGPQALASAKRQSFDLVLLDIMLPGRDGLEVCRAIRQRQDVPIVMLTARAEEADRVLGLESGADDYVTKPFSSRELLARIRAHVRRARGRTGPAEKVLRAGRLTLDTGALTVTVDDKPIALTGYEFALLRAFVERPGRVLSREQLLDIAKGSAEDAFDRSIDGHISRLRHKLGDDPRHPRLLKTVRGAGYVLADTDDN
ncbi:MAG: Phosphate regulon transcriptional regulatory protein PhoB [Myxococcales bacterium]|nr:Phosphate regulon transcriptional regulatory protein PhoB [Myxococcales bacterium]